MSVRALGQRGFSILEVTVASGLLLVLTGGLYLVTIGGMRYFRHGEIYQTVQYESSLALTKMSREIENSRAECIFEEELPAPHIIFPSADLPQPADAGVWSNPTGRLQWEKWVCFYYDAPSRRILRTELQVPPLPATDPPEPGEADYPDFATMSDPALNRSVIARHISDFDVLIDSAFGGGRSVNLGVSARLATDSDRATEVNIRNRIYPKNSDSL